MPYQLHCWPDAILELLEGTELLIEELLVLTTDELLGLDELLGTAELLGLEELLVATLDELAALDELIPPLLLVA